MRVILSLIILLYNFSVYANSLEIQLDIAANLSGIVTYSDGQPASFVVVRLGDGEIYTTTNENGKYNFHDVPFGKHKLTIKALGVKEEIVYVNIDKGKKIFPIRLKDAAKETSLTAVEINGVSKSQQLKTKGYAMDVIKTEKSALQSVQTTELLDRAAGVRLRQSGGMGSTIEYNINGLSGNAVRIFIDGIPVRNYGSSFSISSLSPALIERIEVYKGVVPTHLSEDALGGAINIILKKSSESGKKLSTSYSFGSFNTHQWNMNGNYTDNKSGFTVIANAFYNYTDNNYKVWGNQVKITDTITNLTQKVKAKRFHDSYQSYGINVDAGFVGVKWADRLLIGLLYSDMDKDVQHGGSMDVVYGNRRMGQKTKMANLRYEKQNILKKLDLSTFVSYTDGERWVVDTIPYIYNWLGQKRWDKTTQDYYKRNVGGGEAGRATLAKNIEKMIANRTHLRYAVHEQHFVNVNYLFNRFTRDVEDVMLPKAEQDLTDTRYLTKQIVGTSYENLLFDYRLKTSVFWKYYKQDMKLKDPLKVDNVMTSKEVKKSTSNNGYGLAVSFRIYKDLLIQASFEKAIRLPESNELFGNAAGNILAAYDLQPERSQNYNLGFNWTPVLKDVHAFRVDLNLFIRDIKDMIMRSAENSNTGNYNFENLGKIKSQGFDLELGYAYADKLNVTFNFSLFNARNNLKYDANGQVYSYYKDRLRNAPYLTSNTNLEYNFGALLHKNTTLSMNYNFAYVNKFFRNWESIGSTGKDVIPTQRIHDLGIVYSFAKEKISLSANAKNIFDEQAFDNWALQKPGRAFYGKITYKFF